MPLLVFFPEQHQGYALAAEFLVNNGPVRQDPVPASGLVARREQQLFQAVIVKIVRQRPVQPGSFEPFQVVEHGRSTDIATDRNMGNTEM